LRDDIAANSYSDIISFIFPISFRIYTGGISIVSVGSYGQVMQTYSSITKQSVGIILRTVGNAASKYGTSHIIVIGW
jgi:hypothetical protein